MTHTQREALTIPLCILILFFRIVLFPSRFFRGEALHDALRDVILNAILRDTVCVG